MSKEATAGRVLILAGDGKGKTTSAFGTALRAVGQGMRVLIVQFVKERKCGEHVAAEAFGDDLEIRLGGTGFLSEEPGEREEARRSASRTLERAAAALAGGAFDLVILDEVLFAVRKGLLDPPAVRSAVLERAEGVHVILTGDGPYERFEDVADTITLCRSIKHAYEGGISATPGIEY